MEHVIPEENIPGFFFQRVRDILLADENLGEQKGVYWGKTPLVQYFVFLLTLENVLEDEDSNAKCYRTRLILEEDHWNYEECRNRAVCVNDIFKIKDFDNEKAALKYIGQKMEDLTKGDFDKNITFRVRKVPKGFLEKPDEYLLPGDHIQCFLIETLGHIINEGNHEGIYLGDGLVAHINTEDKTAGLIGRFWRKQEAHGTIDTLEDFLTDPNDDLRVVVSSLTFSVLKNWFTFRYTAIEDENEMTLWLSLENLQMTDISLENIIYYVKIANILLLCVQLERK